MHASFMNLPLEESKPVQPPYQNLQLKWMKNVLLLCYQARLVQPHIQGLTESYQSDIVNVMQRQNEISALLAQQNLCSVLPVRNIPVFDGHPLQYRSFIIRAFGNGVEKKTTNRSDC